MKIPWFMWVALASGCATVRVRSLDASSCATGMVTCEDAKVGKSLGFPVFIPHSWKQYLVVTRSKDGTGSASLLKLPVYPERPNYLVKHVAGWGAHKTSFALDAGVITTFAAESDGKGAETLTALGTFVSGAGSVLSGQGAVLSGQAALDEAAGATVDALQSGKNPFDPVTTDLQTLQSDVAKAGTDAAAGSMDKAVFKSASEALDKAVNLMAGKDFATTLASLAAVRAAIKKADGALQKTCATPAPAPDACKFRTVLASITSSIDKVLTAIYPAGPAANSVEVWEVRPGKTPPLVRVLPNP